MDIIALSAEARTPGKSAARAARRAGSVPCVLYGRHVSPVTFQVTEKSLHPLIYTDETHLVQISLDGGAWECILKDIAFHPVTDRPLHVDFQVLQAGEKVTIAIPVRYRGTPAGQTKGGRPSYSVTELPVTCLPRDIPSQIEVDVSGVEIGQAVHVSDLDWPTLEFGVPDNQILMAVLRPRAAEVPVEEEGELEDAETEQV